MRLFTVILSISSFALSSFAQLEGEVLITPQGSALEYLEQCSQVEAASALDQYRQKEVFESTELGTNQLNTLLEQRLMHLEQLGSSPSLQGQENLQQLGFEGLIVDGSSAAESPVIQTIIVDVPRESVIWQDSQVNQRLANGPSQYDSRIELLELSPLIDWQRNILDNSRSVGIVIERDRLSELTDTLYALDISTKLKTVFRLCPEEPYGEQLSLGVGTAFIVGEDIMMTASHVFEAGIENYVILFNFEIINRGGAVFPIVSKSNVYEIAAVIEDNAELDIVQFRVNRPINAPILKLATTNTLSEGTSIYMIGHPSGLPKKVALNASVYTNDNPFHFYSTLDAFQGNSGSPVFDMATHTVVGVLVSGSQDFTWTGHCNKSNLCYLPYCKGEKVIRFEQILNN